MLMIMSACMHAYWMRFQRSQYFVTLKVCSMYNILYLHPCLTIEKSTKLWQYNYNVQTLIALALRLKWWNSFESSFFNVATHSHLFSTLKQFCVRVCLLISTCLSYVKIKKVDRSIAVKLPRLQIVTSIIFLKIKFKLVILFSKMKK